MEVVEEFDVVDFEQRLTNLKDTQESIQTMSAWCLKHRPNHKKVVSSWLNVLKQVKVEHRLTLFHLANDVIQYSKRKNYEFVDSWGTTLQRATTMVRDEKVKNKIIRIFNIWEQRGIYNEEFLADLHGLLSINPTKKQQPVESDDEQASIVSSNIRNCVRLEKDTDKSFKNLSKTPLCDTENFNTLKDRRHVEDVERDIDEHAKKLDQYIRSLTMEIKARTALIAVLQQADAFYHNQRGEVKVVANAYRNFGNRIKLMKRKVEEKVNTLPSPIPSPDINAPSPEPDNDFDLPEREFNQDFIDKKANGFLSYMDGGKLPFDINDFKSSSPDKSDPQPIQVIGSQTSTSSTKDLADFNIDEFFKSILPENNSISSYQSNLPPQPVPPVSEGYTSIYANLPPTSNYRRQTDMYGSMGQQQQQQQPQLPPSSHQYTPRMPSTNHYGPPLPSQRYNSVPQSISSYGMPPRPPPRYPPANTNYPPHNIPLPPTPVPLAFDGNLSDEYNPESWDMEMSWNSNQTNSFNITTETPASPPHFDQEGVDTDTIEYVDNTGEIMTSETDVDHRELRLPNIPISAISKEKGRALDVDHRNLISLTGSPVLKADKDDDNDTLWNKQDMDFRQTPRANVLSSATKVNSNYSSGGSSRAADADYRVPPPSGQIHNDYNSSRSNNFPPAFGNDFSVPPPPPESKEDTDDRSTAACSDETSKDLFGRISDDNKKTSSVTPFGATGNIPGLTPPREVESPDHVEIVSVTAKQPGAKVHHKSPRGRRDNVETIDMEMSDDDFADFEDLGDDVDSPEDLDADDETALEQTKKVADTKTTDANQKDDTNEKSEVDQDDRQQQQQQQQKESLQQNVELSDIDHRQQFQQFAANQFRSPLFNTPPPTFANNNRMPNRFTWNNTNINNQTGNINFSPRQWNSPQNFRPGVNMNMPRQMRGNMQQMMGAGGNFNSPQNIGGGNFNSPQNLGGINFNPTSSPHPMGGNFNPIQNMATGNNNNMNRFNLSHNLNVIRNQIVNRFNAPQQQPQPLMSIVTQNELEDEIDVPAILGENDDLPSPSSIQSQPVHNDESIIDDNDMRPDDFTDDINKADEISSQCGGDNEGSITGGDIDMRAKPINTSIKEDEQKSNCGPPIIGDHNSNDSSYSNSSTAKPTNSNSCTGNDPVTPIAKPARKPNPFSKPPSVQIPPMAVQQPARSLLELPTTPIVQPNFNNNNDLMAPRNNQFGSPQMAPNMMMGNGGGGGGGVSANIRPGQQQFFSPQLQHSMPFAPNQMRGSPYFRQNRGGPIGGPGRPPQQGINRGGSVGGMGRGGRGGNFRGNW